MKKYVLVALVVGVVALAGFSLWSPMAGDNTYGGEPAAIAVGTTSHVTSALIHIADNRSFFADNGLSVTIAYYDSGKSAVEHLLENDVDLAGATEFIIVSNAFDGTQVRSIATIAKTENLYLVGRNDRGIHNVSDLSGKTVGVDALTLAEFSLGRFLTRNGLSVGQVIPVDIAPSRAAEVLERGDVDAVITWYPYLETIQQRMGSSVVVWPAQNSQPYYWNVICTDAWLSEHPDLARRFVQSLALAEDYAMLHPAEAKAIVQDRLNLDADYMEQAWPENQFVLSLDQSMILAMEDEARWMIANNLTNASAIPDFREYVSTRGLETLKPGSVYMI